MQFFLLIPLVIFFATFKVAYGDESTSDIALASKKNQEVAPEFETENDEEVDDDAAKYRWLAPLLYDELEERAKKGKKQKQNAGNSSEPSVGSNEEEEEEDKKPKNRKNKGKKKKKGKKKGKKGKKKDTLLIKITEEGMLKLLINNKRTVSKKSDRQDSQFESMKSSTEAIDLSWTE